MISLFPIHPISTVRFDHVVHGLDPTVSIDIETLPGQLGRSQGVSLICWLDSMELPVPVHSVFRASKNQDIHSGSYPSITGFEFGI